MSNSDEFLFLHILLNITRSERYQEIPSYKYLLKGSDNEENVQMNKFYSRISIGDKFEQNIIEYGKSDDIETIIDLWFVKFTPHLLLKHIYVRNIKGWKQKTKIYNTELVSLFYSEICLNLLEKKEYRPSFVQNVLSRIYIYIYIYRIS